MALIEADSRGVFVSKPVSKSMAQSLCVFETTEREAIHEFTIKACHYGGSGGIPGDSGRGGIKMEPILEHLFQGDIVFPQSAVALSLGIWERLKRLKL